MAGGLVLAGVVRRADVEVRRELAMGSVEPSGAGTSVIILDPGLKQSKFMRILDPAGRPVRTVGRYLRQVDSAKVAFWADNPAPTGTIDLLIPRQPAGWKSLKVVAGGDNLSRRVDQSGEQIKMDDWLPAHKNASDSSFSLQGGDICALNLSEKENCVAKIKFSHSKLCLEVNLPARRTRNKQGRAKVAANGGEPWLHPLTCVRATYKGTIKDEMFPAATATPAWLPKTYLVGYSDGGRKVPSPVWFVV